MYFCDYSREAGDVANSSAASAGSQMAAFRVVSIVIRGRKNLPAQLSSITSGPAETQGQLMGDAEIP